MINQPNHPHKSQTQQQISDKTCQFRNKIRERQHHQHFQAIRQQYLTYQSHQQQQQQYPLTSRILQKFHHLSHQQITQNVQQIARHLEDYNVYLSEFQRESQQGGDMIEGEGRGHGDQQGLLINDLFYLAFETIFKIPRKFRFLRNGSPLVASYVSLVSADVMPDQLAYWLKFMTQQDKTICYLNITGGQEHQSLPLTQHSSPNKHLHYQSWINHPILRNQLLQDFIQMEAAAEAVREIVGFRGVHPDRLKDENGVSLYEMLCDLLANQLEGMRQVGGSGSGQDENCISPLKTVHMEISVKVLQAKKLSGQNPQHLSCLVTRILTSRIESSLSPISPLFCIWVIDCLLNHNIQLLSPVGNKIMMEILRYDWENFVAKVRGYGFKISQERVWKFEKIVKEKEKEKERGIGEQKQQDISDQSHSSDQFAQR